MNNQIRNGFREARIAKGLSEMEIASKFNVNITIVKGWETGIILPPIDILCELAILLDVTMDMLLLSEKRKPLTIEGLRNADKESVRRLYMEIR